MASKRIIWRILISRLRKHAMFHLIIPLVIGILVEALVEVFLLREHDSSTPRIAIFWLYVFSLRTVSLIAGVFASYIFIMYSLINKETAVTNATEVALKHLQDTLNQARSYIGVSSIPLGEWFDPSMQVYLAKLINRKAIPDNFQHERTLLFFSNREAANLNIPFMDENHYGRCLALIHRDSEIPLSFLTRKQIFDILNSDRFSESDRETLGCYPRWASWRFTKSLRRIPLIWLRRRIPTLDFALVRTAENEPVVLRVSKSGEEVLLDERRDERAKPYLTFLDLINKEVHDPRENLLIRDYDFVYCRGLDRREPIDRESLLHFFNQKIHGFTSAPYREDFVKEVTIDYAKAKGVYVVEDKTSYKCRTGSRYIQDKIEWSLRISSRPDRVHAFKVTITIPIETFRSNAFKTKHPEITKRREVFEPTEERLRLGSGETLLRYSVSLEKFREIDNLAVETEVKYEGASNGHLVWGMSYPTKSLYILVTVPQDRQINASIFGVEAADYAERNERPWIYSLNCSSWMLPTTGLVIEFCESRDPTGEATTPP